MALGLANPRRHRSKADDGSAYAVRTNRPLPQLGVDAAGHRRPARQQWPRQLEPLKLGDHYAHCHAGIAAADCDQGRSRPIKARRRSSTVCRQQACAPRQRTMRWKRRPTPAQCPMLLRAAANRQRRRRTSLPRPDVSTCSAPRTGCTRRPSNSANTAATSTAICSAASDVGCNALRERGLAAEHFPESTSKPPAEILRR